MTYEYSSGNGSNTTSDTIDKVTLRMTNTQFSYVYDDCNNITEIYKNNSLIRKYSYDVIEQQIVDGTKIYTRQRKNK